MSQIETPQLDTAAFVFDATVMGCQLLERALQTCKPRVSVIGYSTTSLDFSISQLEQADVALISTSLQGAASVGFALVKMLRQSTSVRPIMLFDENNDSLVIEAFRSGAFGVIERDNTCEMLCKCLRCVRMGQVWASSTQLHWLLHAFGSGQHNRLSDSRVRPGLTERERQIAFLVAEGLRNKEIASRLRLSEHTVKNYIFHIFEKLGVRNRSELVMYSTERDPDTGNLTSKTA
jgi:DNA-binding NarL/FixJ family response regulator